MNLLTVNAVERTKNGSLLLTGQYFNLLSYARCMT